MDAFQFAESIIGELTQDRSIARSYPWLLVDRDIVSPSELIGLDAHDLDARWGKYDKPNRLGIVQTVFSCRNYARLAAQADVTFIPYPYPDYPGSFACTSPVPVILFWPPKSDSGPVEYIAHWGTVEAATDALYWLIQQTLPTFNGVRAQLQITSGGKPYEPDLIPVTKSLFEV